MTAARHAADANAEALRLHLAIQGLCEKVGLGETITIENLGAVLRTSACVQFHTARTMYAVSQFATPDRRAPAPAPLGDIPTPLAALEVLLAEAELSLDYRTSFRHAMSSAHCAIANASKLRAVLHGEIVLGERVEIGDEELTFGDLFGEPDRSAIDVAVLACARGMTATDGAVTGVAA